MALRVARASRLEGVGEPSRRSRRPSPARPVRRGPRPGRAPGRRGRRPLPRLLEEPGHRRDAEAAGRAGARVRRRGAPRRDVRAASTSTSRRTGPCSTWRCGCRATARWSSTARTSSSRSTRCSTGCPRSPSGSARGEWTGHTGKPIRNVINIGIGGSDLGPVMAYEALRHYSKREMTFRFVSNVDGTDFAEKTRDLDPEETLFVVSSKTFTTLETMTNAHTARRWALDALGDEAAIAKHFVAVSTNAEEVVRSSGSTPRTCSASGSGSAAATRWTRRSGSRRCSRSAPRRFGEMLAGFHAVDEHFAETPLGENLPALMGLLARLVRRLLRRPDRRRSSPTTSTCTASRPTSSS